MSYDPNADFLSSPTEMGHLYGLATNLAVDRGTFVLGNPDRLPETRLDEAGAAHSQFYGFAFERAGSQPEPRDRELAYGEVPIAAHPPTYHLRSETGRLCEQLPQLSDVLGVLATVGIRYHLPYIHYDGDPENIPGLDAAICQPSVAFVIDCPSNPGLRKRLYKVVPEGPCSARGTRIDLDVNHNLRRTETDTFPHITHTEGKLLVALARTIGDSFAGGSERTPQEED